MSPFSTSRGVVPRLFRLGAAPRARLRRLASAAAVLAAGVWLWHWISTDEQGEPLTAKPDAPSLQIDDLRSFLVRRDGLPLWEISARHVAVAGDGLSTLATGVDHGTLFRAGKPFLHLSAPLVRVSNPASDLEASGGVSATGPDGFSFQTSRAFWQSQQQIVNCPRAVTAWLRGLWFQTPNLGYDWKKGVLTCPDRVEMRGQGIVMRGKNLEATLGTRLVKMSGGVEIVIDPHAAKIPTSIPTLAASSPP